MKKNKILEEALLYEDEEDDEENKEDEFNSDMIEPSEQESEIEIERMGPHGEIYASSSSGEEIIEDEEGEVGPKRYFFAPHHQHAYGQ